MEIGLSVSPTRPWRTGGPFSGHATLTSGLVSYWKLNEVSGDRADSVGSNTLTDNNTVTSAAGVRSLAASFVAANSEKLTRASFAAHSGVFTWSLWLKRQVITDTTAIISKMPAWGNSIEYVLYTSGAGVNLNFTAGDGTALKSAAKAADTIDQWYFVVFWLESDKTLHIQVDNGTAVDSAAMAGTPASGSDTLWFSSGEGVVGFTDMYLDEVGYWSRVLTAQERTDLYNAGAGLFY